MGTSLKNAVFLVESRLRDAARGSVQAYYELGMVFSSGAEGADVDLIEAHKWFNLAAMRGNARAQECRAEVAEDMSAREIAAAQKAARAWLQRSAIRAAA
ncbi:SEL1-like repeat protein [Sphingomonas sp.]|uniref:SEL1-like repeat protein n=1 Tax=Sphingomonas sp. TaxID=28214 RepID=UPI002CE07255|nr:SEL1-like repeat protein [Sphingomonas sp.]HWK35208.1 SEL1-like repeat protein [Sphingomonas sp.]